MRKTNQKRGRLVLTRRPAEFVRIFTDKEKTDYIDITMVEARGQQVRFIVDAPIEWHVLRAELLPENRIKRIHP